MTQWLKSPSAIVEDPGSVPNTHMVTHNHIEHQFQERDVFV